MLRNPGPQNWPFPSTSWAALDKQPNLLELLFSHWEIWKRIITIIIIPHVMIIMKVKIINVTVFSLLSNNTWPKMLDLYYYHGHDFSFPTSNFSGNSLTLSHHSNFFEVSCDHPKSTAYMSWSCYTRERKEKDAIWKWIRHLCVLTVNSNFSDELRLCPSYVQPILPPPRGPPIWGSRVTLIGLLC